MSPWLAGFIALLQGSTELFPVSSLGHAVVVPNLLRLDFRPTDDSFVPFLVLLHLGTATALLILYREEWKRIIAGFLRAAVRGRIQDPDERMALLIVAGTIPTGVVGFFLEKPLKSLFGNPRAAGAFLIVNAAILLGAELLRRRSERAAHVEADAGMDREAAFRTVETLDWRSALLVGACQTLALLPGISRAGVTMAGGLVAGLRHEESARFSFLLATPIILAAGVLEVPQLFQSGVPIGTYLAASVLAGVVAYMSARFLIRYFRVGRLDPFAAYCAALGIITLAFAR
ncbi:MAG TPA: undecaprenyl-diphosphate phosphatase [Candidatus Dormibacteraeota bacterium]|jgi:undecaprenyl-diphosphatase|nr:undecaprenyl-diphosphate phosphatase [Candidatus Dormibacteraeota bacterium]